MSLKLSRLLFFFVLIFSPLAFGTTEPWSYAIMEISAGLACLLFFFSLIKHQQDLHQVPGLLPLALFLLYLLFGLVPLPPFIVELISPNAFKIHQITHSLTDHPSWMTLSLNPKATLSEFFRYTTYVMFYVLTIQLLKSKTMLKATALTIAVFGGLLAFSSILQFYLTDDMALWFRHSPVNSIVVGPYANHNHYAGLMEMIFPVVLGLFLFYRPRIGNTSIIRGIAEIFNQEKANIHILIGTSALLILISIFVSLSRGAMISTCLSLVVFTCFLMQRKISRGNSTMLIAVIILAVLCIGWFGWDQIFERFARLKNAQGVIYEYRLDFWKDTINIIRDYGLTGSGFGTYSSIYPLYATISSQLLLTHAHNDYLELLAEGGMIGFSLVAAFFISFFYKTHTVFTRRRDAFCIYLYIGCISAISAILFHSFTDFNLHIGANGLWFFFLAGTAVCAANTGVHGKEIQTRLPKISSFPRKMTGTMIALGFVLLVSLYNFSNLMGILYYSTVDDYAISADTPLTDLEKIDRISALASRFDPLTASYVFKSANAAWFSGDIETAKDLFYKAIRLDPLNARYLNRLAMFHDQTEQWAKTRLAFQAATLYDRTSPEYAFQFGIWLLAQKEMEAGLNQLKKTLELDESYFSKAMTAMVVAGVSTSDMENTIPDLPGPAIEYAHFLAQTGDLSTAISNYMAALDTIDATYKNPPASDRPLQNRIRYLYYKIFRFFIARNDIKNAMHVMERAEIKLPMDAAVKVSIGDLYLQQGIQYKALDKYQHALLLDPGNKKALHMIRKINP